MERIIWYVQQQWCYPNTLLNEFHSSLLELMEHSGCSVCLAELVGRLEAALKWCPYLTETGSPVSHWECQSHIQGINFVCEEGEEERGLPAPVPGKEQKQSRNSSFSSLLRQEKMSRARQGISNLRLLSKLGCMYVHGEFEVNLTSNSCSSCHIHLLEHLEQMIWLL